MQRNMQGVCQRVDADLWLQVKMNFKNLFCNPIQFIFKTINRSLESVESVAIDMVLALELFFKTNVNIQDYSIQLINTSFRTGQSIKIEEASKELVSRPGIIVKYDKEHYHGIQVIEMTNERKKIGKEMRRFTAAIFRSGTMIIQGALNSVEWENTARNVLTMFRGLPESVLMSEDEVQQVNTAKRLMAKRKASDSFDDLASALGL
jgi:TATA-box binding protein (TBP) (component of TFIID and TFIIIB)